MVLNLAPVGCYPAILTGYTHTDADLDKYGCLIPVNKAVKYYNTLLNKTLSQTRTELKNATVIYLDTHKILLDLFQHPKSYGTLCHNLIWFSCTSTDKFSIFGILRNRILLFCFHI